MIIFEVKPPGKQTNKQTNQQTNQMVICLTKKQHKNNEIVSHENGRSRSKKEQYHLQKILKGFSDSVYSKVCAKTHTYTHTFGEKS